MADVKFTKDQQKAIDTLDRSILVSAAAGSGKTAVLIQRIINIILSGEADVDRMLVVTFTNAAAAEMKLKLTKAIRKAIREDPSRSEVLNRQLGMMYRSYISTFHSFAKRVIKEFFYKIDIDPDFSICDEAQAVLLQMEAIDELFEDAFDDDALIPGGSFRDFLLHYSSDRSEDAIQSEMLSTYGRLRSMPNYFEWAYEKAEQLRFGDDADDGGVPDEEAIKRSSVYRMASERIATEICEADDSARLFMDMLCSAGLETTPEKFEPEIAAVKRARGLAEAGDAAGALASLPEKFVRFGFGKGEKEEFSLIKDDAKELRDSYKNTVSGILSKYGNGDFGEAFRRMQETYRYTVYYLNVLSEFERRYDEKKRAANLMDYSDLEHTAVRILDDPETAAVLRDRFKFIFIDEYQDTNRIQEHLISRIARPDNLFKVGDVKQSIYGFRQSEPAIFMDTMDRYRDPDNADAVTIDLNMNFRSSQSTINYINDVFRSIMQGYDSRAMLYKGRKDRPEMDLTPEVHVLVEEDLEHDVREGMVPEDIVTGLDLTEDAQEGGDEAEAAPADGDPGAADTPEGEDEEERSRLEAEADYVAGIVDGIIGTEFYDGGTGTVRKAEPRDIVILLRSSRMKADAYYKAMMSRNILAHVSDDSGYFDTVEVAVAMSLLQVTDNMRQDIPLISVLHSEIFGFSAGDLGEIRAESMGRAASAGSDGKTDGPARSSSGSCMFCDAFVRYAESGSSSGLRARAAAALEKIRGWRRRAGAMELDDFVWYVLNDSGYYMYAGAMYGGRQRQANLRALADRARAFREQGIASLSGFIRYLNILKKKDVRTGQAMMVSKEDNLVRIMTIHKSKGLEFPFVIVAGMGSHFNTDTSRKGFYLDPDIGVGLSYVDHDRHMRADTLIQDLILDKKRDDEFSEELRVLYVAMTRAREKLVLVGTVRKAKNVFEGKPGRGSFLDVMKDVIGVDSCRLTVAPADRRVRRSAYTGIEVFLEKHEKMGRADGALADEIERRLGFRYPDGKALVTRAKYSVSEIRIGEKGEETLGIEREYPLKLEAPEFTGTRRVTPAEKGTAYHRIMEFLDFGRVVDAETGKCDAGYIESSAEKLMETGAVERAVGEKVDLGRIAEFFRSDAGRRAAAASRAGRLMKEKPFTLRMEHGGRNVLVQGIIDCFFEDEGGLVLIDYKSSRVSGKNAESRIADEYRTQIDIYRRALESGTGRKVTGSYLYLFDSGELVDMDG